MNEETFKQRTKTFALNVIKIVEKLPKTRIADTIGGQLLRAGTSVGANYRAPCRARSVADIIAKLGIVEEEADESAYWMELLETGGIVAKGALQTMTAEANEITAMTVASIKTLKKRNQKF